MKQAEAKADTAWRKSRLAARLLLRKESRPLRPREQALARQLSQDSEVTNRLIQQALYFLGVGPRKHAFDQKLFAGGNWLGLGEQPDDLQPFDAKQFAQALFEE